MSYILFQQQISSKFRVQKILFSYYDTPPTSRIRNIKQRPYNNPINRLKITPLTTNQLIFLIIHFHFQSTHKIKSFKSACINPLPNTIFPYHQSTKITMNINFCFSISDNRSFRAYFQSHKKKLHAHFHEIVSASQQYKSQIIKSQ